MPSADELLARSGSFTDPVPEGDFARDLAVRPDPAVAGRYHADISEAWRIFYAFGGASMAVALRAAEEALGRPDLDPLTATAVFCSPVPCGPVVVDTDVLRNGKGAAQAVARLRSGSSAEGATDLHLTTIFGRSHATHIDFTEVTFPSDALPIEESKVPPPMSEDSPFRNINYHHQTEHRTASDGFTMSDPSSWKPGPARTMTWHRLRNEPRRSDGTIDPVSYCMPADILGPAVFAKLGPIGPDNPPFLVLSLEISVQFIRATTSPWFLQHCRVSHASDGYALANVELWDEHQELVAIVSQRGHVRPVTVDRFAAPDGTA